MKNPLQKIKRYCSPPNLRLRYYAAKTKLRFKFPKSYKVFVEYKAPLSIAFCIAAPGGVLCFAFGVVKYIKKH